MTYEEIVSLSGHSEQTIQKMVHFDNVEEGHVNDVDIRHSPIHGKGLFTTVDIPKGALVGPSLLNGKRTELGRWVNHSDEPNCRMVIVKDGLHSYVEALRDISTDEELTMDYQDNITKQQKVMAHMVDYINQQDGALTEMDDSHNIYPNVGMYARYVKLKAGTALVGAIHKEWSLNILASGVMRITNDPTEESIRIEAPFIFETSPNTQKFGMCVTDCVFMNIMRSENETKEEAKERLCQQQ